MLTATCKHLIFQANFISLIYILECGLFQACEFFQESILNQVKNLQMPGKKKKKGIIVLD